MAGSEVLADSLLCADAQTIGEMLLTYRSICGAEELLAAIFKARLLQKL